MPQSVDPKTLNNAELRKAIQTNSEALAAIDRQRADIASGHSGVADAKALQNLADQLEEHWEQLRRDYEALRAEDRLRRNKR